MRHETHWGVIFANVVVRATAALEQYKHFSRGLPPGERYEATLTLSVTQTVLGAAAELEKAMTRQGKEGAPDLDDLLPLVRLEENTNVERDPETGDLKPEQLTGKKALDTLRDAMAHPVPCTDQRSKLPVTGYVSVPDGEGSIGRFEFINSPWVELQEGKRNSGRPIIKHPYAPKTLKGNDANRAKTRKVLNDGLTAYQKKQDRGLYLHQEGDQLSIRVEGATDDFVPYIRLSASVDDLAAMCHLVADAYSRWLDTVAPPDAKQALAKLLPLPGVPRRPDEQPDRRPA